MLLLLLYLWLWLLLWLVSNRLPPGLCICTTIVQEGLLVVIIEIVVHQLDAVPRYFTRMTRQRVCLLLIESFEGEFRVTSGKDDFLNTMNEDASGCIRSESRKFGNKISGTKLVPGEELPTEKQPRSTGGFEI